MDRRGWSRALALALVAWWSSATHPALLIALPLAVLLVALPPARSPHRLLGVIVLALLFATPASGPLWYAERGWALLLAATFLVAVALRPGTTFLPRGLAAVAATTGVAAVVMIASSAWSNVEWAVSRRFRDAAGDWMVLLEQLGRPADAVGSAGSATAEAAGGSTQFARAMAQVVDLEIMLYPAMLALASLAALGVAWWGYRRLVGPEGVSLAPLREFRFADHLVWVLIAGIVLLVTPVGDVAVRVGANLTTFMAALYVLRGVAIVIALTGMSGAMLFLLGFVALLLLPLFAGPALVIGLSDTWLDLRRRGSAGDAASS